MIKIIESFDGDTAEIERLRLEIGEALEMGPVSVKLWQPGIIYEKNNKWLTVIDFINEWQDKPVTFYSNLVPLKKTKCDFHYTNDMFISGHKLYETNEYCKKILERLQPLGKKRQFLWEFMFGQFRPYKDIFFERFKKHPVSNYTFFNYFRKDPSSGIWSNGVTPCVHTAETIDGNQNPFDSPVRHSDLIDLEIYDNSYYSVAIETVIHNDFAMFSEKEAKPIMAKRPFIVMGARHQLKAFRSLGFKTFSPCIDESYDEIEDTEQRFEAVMTSMLALCEKDPVEVYDLLHDTLEHNKKHFIETSWLNV